jgi:ubiquinone/menaquinone biosynthesis C-methylase UbiE
MATPPNPRREHPSTYMVQDRFNEEERIRLAGQDHFLTTGMGGILPEQPDPTSFRKVLDVGCGTGGWLIEAAQDYPGMTRLVGVDISSRMIEYARRHAADQQVSDRVTFRGMDALRMLEFPNNSFDLVNQRLGMSYLRTLDWPKLLGEFRRVTRPDGVIRITESAMIVQSTSSALMILNDLLLDAFQQAGHYFQRERDGVIERLAPLLIQYGFQNVKKRVMLLDFHAGTEEGNLFAEDIKRAFRTLLPFLRKWSQVPADYEMIYQQALSEMQHPNFVATWKLLTAWGTCRP